MDHAASQVEEQSLALSKAKRALLLRDGLVFLTLTLIALVLYGVTLALFRSFERHRADLAVYWADRGRDEVQHGQAVQAVASLRNALSYDPDNRGNELLLAEALSNAGQIEQATNYFLNLRDIRPGDGFINLQLARLARSKGTVTEAVDDYHASIFGDWGGDGAVRRRNVRLELADYLTSLHQPEAARAELLIASGNAPNDPKINVTLGAKFAAIGDVADALSAYKKAEAADSHNEAVVEAIGRLSFQAGDYERAHTYLEEALALGISDQAEKSRVMAMAAEAGRSVDLSFSRGLSARQRTEHLFVAKDIAETRLRACSTQLGDPALRSSAMQDLAGRWKATDKQSRRSVQQDADAQDSMADLINDTEVITAKECGQPSGDDALLLKLAGH